MSISNIVSEVAANSAVRNFAVAQQQLINTNTAVKINSVPEETTQRDKTVTYTLYGKIHL